MNITEAILHLVPNAKFMCWENNYDRIEWSPSNVTQQPTLAELTAALPLILVAKQKKEESDAAKISLTSLGSQSLSLMREYIVSKPDAPAALIAIQAAVVEALKKVKP